MKKEFRIPQSNVNNIVKELSYYIIFNEDIIEHDCICVDLFGTWKKHKGYPEENIYTCTIDNMHINDIKEMKNSYRIFYTETSEFPYHHSYETATTINKKKKIHHYKDDTHEAYSFLIKTEMLNAALNCIKKNCLEEDE